MSWHIARTGRWPSLSGVAGVVLLIGVLAAGASAGPIVVDSPDLPPKDGQYRTPTDVHAEFSGPDLAIVLMDVVHRPFQDPPPVRTPVGPDEIETFESVAFGEVSIETGELTGTFPFELFGPVTTVVFGKVGNTTGTFDTEILSMDLTGSVITPLGDIPVTVRESPTQASTGQTTVEDLGGGLFQIDSFFDVFTELEIDLGVGVPTDAPDAPMVIPSTGSARVDRNWNSSPNRARSPLHSLAGSALASLSRVDDRLAAVKCMCSITWWPR